MNSTPLKPCPFCGEEKRIGVSQSTLRMTSLNRKRANIKVWTVNCMRCSTIGPYGLEEAMAVGMWNARGADAMIVIPAG
jgi:hypothetical protein